MRDVAGKVAFITGGASGMGLAMARSFSRAGMKVVIADIEQSALDQVAEEFAASNAEHLTLKVDVTDRDAMEQAAAATIERFGKVHVLCNNAGVAVGGSIADMNYNDWDWVTRVNIDGVVNGVQTFLPRLTEHGEGGHVVNTASIAGHIAIPGLSVYTATKFAVVGLSETMRGDLTAHNVGVSVLCPGFVATNIFNSERNRPEDLPGSSTLQGMGGTEQQDEELALDPSLSNALDPDVVGDMVLHAIQEDEFYIFTHPEFSAAADLRSQEMGDAYARWQTYREERSI